MKLVTPFILVIISIGAFLMYINPHYAVIKDLQVEVSEYEDALSEVREAEQIFDEKLNRYNAINSADLQKLEKLLPDSIDNIRLLLDLSDIAAGYGTTIKNIEVQPVTDTGKGVPGPDTKVYNSLQVSFTVSMTYDVYIEFIKDLERSLRLVDLTSTAFQSTDSNIYNFQISFKTYWLKHAQ